MDYISLKAAVSEASAAITGSKVVGVLTPSPGETILDLAKSRLVLLSTSAEHPGLFLPPEGLLFQEISTPFAGLLRGRLAGSSITSVELPWPGERIVRLTFSAVWPRRAEGPVHLILEVMGRHSSLTLTDHKATVLGSAKAVPPTVSRARPLTVGNPWEPPPARPGLPVETALNPQGKVPALADEADLVQAVRGLSPWTAGQALRLVQKGMAPDLKTSLARLVQTADGREGYLTAHGNLRRLSPFEPTLDPGDRTERMEPFSAAAWAWKASDPAGKAEPVGRASELSSALVQILGRIGASLARLEEEERRCLGHETVSAQAEALLLNLRSIPRGARSARLATPDGRGLPEIELDPSLSAQENANRLFDLARRMRRGLEEVRSRRESLGSAREETMAASAALAAGDSLPAEKLVGASTAGRKGRRGGPAAPGRRHTHMGFDILVGKNALDNAEVTFRSAGPSDIWLHARDYPGSHVVILAGKRPVPEEVVRFAARLAAENSGARGDTAPEVMVTERKWVRKLKCGKPGQVTVERFRTVRVRIGNNSR